jgi:hypothetical protein
MRVDVRRVPAPDLRSLRIQGTIDASAGRRDIWFDVPIDLEPALSNSGEAWLLLMLPLAAQTGESVDLALPVDPLFLENLRGLIGTWHGWYPDLARAELRAPTARAAVTEGRAAQFFSGGVDSWFTLLRHTESTERFPQVGDVDDLITVWGFDIPIERGDEFALLAGSLGEVADHYGKRALTIATNLRERMEGSWKEVWGPRWGPLTHGTALAATAMLFKQRYATVKIASTHRFWEPFAYGSHPMTDTLFSTSTTAFMHDHALYSRTDKVERIAESDFALSKLKVCYAHGTFRNCSQCVKCHRMLLCFDVLGILDKATTFDRDVYERNRNRPFLVWSENDLVRALEVAELALRHGRSDIARIIEQSVERSKRIKSVTEPLKRISWRVWDSAYRRMAADMIGA